MIRRLAALLAAPLMLAACVVGPNYHRPRLSPAAGLGPVEGPLVPGEDIPAQWWTVFHSAELDDLVAHHAERLDETEKILTGANSAQTAWQIAVQVTWSRAWSELASFQRQAAIGEVLSHLRQLQARGLATEADADGVGLWSAQPTA